MIVKLSVLFVFKVLNHKNKNQNNFRYLDKIFRIIYLELVKVERDEGFE
jgi:hypothetical protein